MKWLREKIGKRRIRFEKEAFKKVLGLSAIYSIGYGDVGSSIYYALGITAVYALGATPIALAIAGVVFFFTALTYAEGTAMIPESGGSASFARYGFNELIAFIAGWSLMLSYVATISISAVTVPYYLAHFFPHLKTSSFASTLLGMDIILFLMFINIIGVKESSKMNLFFCLLDLVTQFILVIGGFLLLFKFETLKSYVGGGAQTWPSLQGLFMGASMAMVAYIGLESTSQMAEETKDAERTVPRSLILIVITVLFMYAGVSLVALSAMTPQALITDWKNDPIAGIAYSFREISPIFSNLMAPWVAILAITILLSASNAGLLGVSRLMFSMGGHKQLPSILFRLHKKSNTPYMSITAFSIVAILLLIPGLFNPDILVKVGEVYVFGAMVAFSFAHASIIALRIKKPDSPRPFKTFGVKIKGKEISVTAVIGLICTIIVWLVMLVSKPFGRTIGLLWICVGIIFYIIYRKSHHLSVFKIALAEKPEKVIFEPTKIKHILVPTTGTPFCEEMVESACKIAQKDDSLITAMYVIEVPMALSLEDNPMEDEYKEGESALTRAKSIGKEYGIKIDTHIIKSRSAGKSIVEKAKGIDCDLIFLGASGKVRLGELRFGKTGLYVVENAPCRVWTSMVAIE